jgi:hypothetical protein
MRLHRGIAWLVTAASVAGIPGAVAAPNPRPRDGACPAARISQSALARRDLGTKARGISTPGLGQAVRVTVPRGPLMVIRIGTNRVRVVDARSARSGWTLRVRTSATPAVRVCVKAIEANARSTRGLHPTNRSDAHALLTSAPNTGNGAFDVEFGVATASGLDTRNTERILATIRFDITPTYRRVSSAAAG